MPRLPAVIPRARAKRRARDTREMVRRAAAAIASAVSTPIAVAQVGGRSMRQGAASRARAAARAGSRAAELGAIRVRGTMLSGGQAAGSIGAAIRETAVSARERPAAMARARARRRRRSRATFTLGGIAGVATGYVVGARAGRERYDQLRVALKDLAADPRVKQLGAQGGSAIRNAGVQAGKLADRAASSAADALRRRREAAERRRTTPPAAAGP